MKEKLKINYDISPTKFSSLILQVMYVSE